MSSTAKPSKTFAHMVAPEGYVFLIIVPHHWAKGPTPLHAMLNVQEHGGQSCIEGAWQLFLADPKASVDEVSGSYITRPKNGKPHIAIGSYKPLPAEELSQTMRVAEAAAQIPDADFKAAAKAVLNMGSKRRK